MSNFVVSPPAQPAVSVTTGGLFPVRRIFCVGRNYADHVKEMGGDPKKSDPVFFTKPGDAVHPGGDMPFPPATSDLHYEGELVVALKSGGRNIDAASALDHVFGYAAGCDLTRRDLQHAAKDKGAPWDTAKALDNGAVIGPIVPVAEAGDISAAALSLIVNGEVRQSAPFSLMIWTLEEIVASLSTFFELKAGDLIYTGTPEGVGPLAEGDVCEVTVTGLPPVAFTMTAPLR